MSITLTEARQFRNHLLDKLPDDELAPFLSLFDLVETNVKDVIARQGEQIRYVYFPCNCALSCIVYMEGGSGIEVGTVGNEGFTCVEALFNAEIALETVVCQIAGVSLRMRIDHFRQVLNSPGRLNRLLQCSGQAYLSQVSQSVACNRLHSIDMRFARWMLITHDRVQGDEFSLTQEFLAAMLGVHRPSVSTVAGMFQQAGMIKYSRGRVKILNRALLEESSCECYAVVRSHFERLLGMPYG
jgi:CRP-like cAMP-binding protein